MSLLTRHGMAAVFCFASIAFAQTTINVPANQPTIQAGINAAATGDTVLVAPGTYAENIHFSGKSITVKSADGPSVTTITGNTSGAAVNIGTGSGPTTVFRGFTIRNASGYGVSVNNASPTIQDNDITENCGGIYLSFSSAIVKNNVIHDNGAICFGSGSGIYIGGNSQAHILDNIIRDNTGSEGAGIELFAAGTPLIRGNLLQNNQAQINGGAIYMVNVSDANIINNVIVGNTASQGGAVGWLVPSGARGPYLLNNTIVDNNSGTGAALYGNGYDSQVALVNNIIVAKAGQKAIQCDALYSNLPPTFRNNTVVTTGTKYSGKCTDQTGLNGNISASPLFISALDFNFHLTPDSPGIDAGDNAAASLPSIDADSNPRIFDGDANGSAIVDMGAFEFRPTTATVEPDSLFFDQREVFTPSDAKTVTVTNTGSYNLFLGAVTLPASYSQTNDCLLPKGILPSGTCTISIIFSPLQRGPIDGSMTMRANVTNSTITVALSGSGIGPEVSIAPTSLIFDPQLFGTTSAVKTFIITNAGELSLQLTGIQASGDFAQTNDCLASLGASQSCTVSVTFSPSLRGLRSGSVTITDNAPGSPHTVPLSGTGLAAAAILAPTGLNFGSRAFATTSAAQNVTLTNSGDVPLVINSKTISGDFAQTNDCPESLAVAAACTFQVTFTPTQRGSRTGSLTVSDNAPGSPHAVALTGFGTGPEALLGSSQINFGNQLLQTISSARTISLRNIGDAPMIIASIIATGDFTQTNTCPATLAVNATCSISMRFTPSQLGTLNGDVTVSYNGPTNQGLVLLSGVGVLVAFNPSSITFPPVVVSKTSAPLTSQLVNSSANPVVIGSVTVAGNFQQQNDCPATLAAAASCTISVTFSPTALGVRTGSVSVADDAPGSPQILSLSGSGVIPQVQISGGPLAFGNHLVGTTSASLSVTILNVGSGPLTVSSLSLPPGFTQTNTCGSPVPSGQSCVVNVSFSPTSATNYAGSLSITSDAPGSPHQVGVSGAGVSAYPAPSITSISPRGALVGSPGATLTLTGTNFFPVSVIRWNGQDRVTAVLSSTQLSTVLSASDLAALTAADVTVFNPGPGGGTSKIAGFGLYRSIPVEARYLAYDSFTRRLLASVGSSAANYANHVGIINPFTGAVENSISIGSNPGRLALTDSARNLFVSLDGAAAVRKVDLVAQTAGPQFGLGSDSFFGPYYVDEMAMLPGSESALAVSRMNLGISPRHAGVAIYDDGVKRTTETPRHTGANSIAFGSSPDLLFGYCNETTEFGFRRMAINASGISTTNVTGNLISGFGVTIASDGTRVFSTTGKVLNPVNATLLGSFDLSESGMFSNYAVLPLATLDRTFLLGVTSNTQIDAFDSNTFTKAGSVYFPFGGVPGSLVRWGTDGLAFRATINNVSQVILVRTSLLSRNLDTSGPATIDSAAPSQLTTGASNTVIAINGSGYVPGMRVLWNGDEKTTVFVSANQLKINVPAADLAYTGPVQLTLVPGASQTPLATTTVNIVGNVAPLSTIAFNPVFVGRKSPVYSTTIQNATAELLSLQAVTTTGDFIVEHQCPAQLGAGSSCDIGISFLPTATGTRIGTLQVQLGGQLNKFHLSGTGFDLQLSLTRPLRPGRSSQGSTASPMEAFASLQITGVTRAQVHLGCVAAASTTCDAAFVSSEGSGSIRVSLHKRGRLLKAGPHSVTLTATVGDYTQTLPIQFNVPAVSETPRKPQRLNRSR